MFLDLTKILILCKFINCNEEAKEILKLKEIINYKRLDFK